MRIRKDLPRLGLPLLVSTTISTGGLSVLQSVRDIQTCLFRKISENVTATTTRADTLYTHPQHPTLRLPSMDAAPYPAASFSIDPGDTPGSMELLASAHQDVPTRNPPPPPPSIGRTFLVIGTVTGVTTVSSMSAGILTVALPRMAKDLHLAESLLLWPSSVYALTCGCSLLVLGAISDLFGSRNVFLAGCFFMALFTAACGLAQTGVQLIGFRALQGIAVSMCLPNTVSILTENFPNGRQRNIGFACLGGGQPVGFSVGLFLSGIFVDRATWRAGWYTCASLTLLILFAGVWGLAKDSKPFSMRKLMNGIDWMGALLSSSCLGLILYVLA